MAAQLEGPDRRVQKIKGGFGEFRVTVDGQTVYDGKRYLYPRPKTVLTAVRKFLDDRG